MDEHCFTPAGEPIRIEPMNFLTIEHRSFTLRVVQVLRDNFVYLLSCGSQAVLIDAGAAKPVLEVLSAEQLTLKEILITHNHPDHIGGCLTLHWKTGVLARSPGQEASVFDVLGSKCQSIAASGHFSPHKLFYFPEQGWLFTGDILINGGCGRVIGKHDTVAKLYESLQIIAALPDETRVFGGHDYLEENLRFALAVDPENRAAHERLAQYAIDPAGAILSTLAEEKRSNPFFRTTSASEFAELRAQKDRF